METQVNINVETMSYNICYWPLPGEKIVCLAHCATRAGQNPLRCV